MTYATLNYPTSVLTWLNSVIAFSRTTTERFDTDIHTAISLGAKGCVIQSQLLKWHLETECRSRNSSGPLDLDGGLRYNSQTLMGYLYYHAMMIYLSAMFNPRYEIWQDDCVKRFLPLRSLEEVDAHVHDILELAEFALQHSTVAGFLLYLPIRIAGQRCKSAVDRLRVHKIISQVADRGFVVVKSLVPVFERLWV